MRRLLRVCYWEDLCKPTKNYDIYVGMIYKEIWEFEREVYRVLPIPDRFEDAILKPSRLPWVMQPWLLVGRQDSLGAYFQIRIQYIL